MCSGHNGMASMIIRSRALTALTRQSEELEHLCISRYLEERSNIKTRDSDVQSPHIVLSLEDT